jgi:hypothetical protein
MHQDRQSMPRQHDVRLSRQILAMQPKAQSPCMQGAANRDLGFGVL